MNDKDRLEGKAMAGKGTGRHGLIGGGDKGNGTISQGSRDRKKRPKGTERDIQGSRSTAR